MTVRPIVVYPDPVLLQPCREVPEITREIRDLIPDMFDTLYAAPGIGLAANQIGLDLRIAVIDLSVGKDPKDRHVLINPVILTTDRSYSEEEGCLSIPDFLEDVNRPHKVCVEALDVEGKKFQLEAEGLLVVGETAPAWSWRQRIEDVEPHAETAEGGPDDPVVLLSVRECGDRRRGTTIHQIREMFARHRDLSVPYLYAFIDRFCVGVVITTFVLYLRNVLSLEPHQIGMMMVCFMLPAG